MKEPKIYKLIDKVLAEQASTAEAAQVDVWYQSFDNRAGFTEGLKEDELQNTMQASFAAVKAAISKG